MKDRYAYLRPRHGIRMTFQLFIFVAGICVISSGDLVAQSVVTADSRIYQNGKSSRIEEILSRPVTMTLARVSRKTAVDAVSKKSGVPVQYQVRLLGAFSDSVTFDFKGVPLRDVLDSILKGTGLRVIPDGNSKLAIVSGKEQGADSHLQDEQQRGLIRGQVVDSATGRGVGGVTIALDGKNTGVLTNENGEFSIPDVSAGEHVLSIRLLGYRTIEQAITVSAGSVTSIQLVAMAMAATLTDVVTTATGDRRRLDVGNSVTVLNVDSIRRAAPITTVTDLLETRVPDLIVTRGSGAPGAPSRIRVRGLSSMNGSNDPIIIVDNVRVYSEQTTTTRYGDQDYSVIDNIDVNSIETIEVLKGPSASALYGSDAANGVIVIKTKRGRAGPTRWTLSMDQGFSTQPTYPNERLYLESTPMAGGLPEQCIVGWSTPCTIIGALRYDPLADDRTTVFGTGRNQRYSFGVSGGTSTVRYHIGAQYISETGILKMSDADAAYIEMITERPVPRWQRKPQENNQITGNAALTFFPLPTLTVNFTSSLGQSERQSTPLANSIGFFQDASPQDTSLVTGRVKDFRKQKQWREKSVFNAMSADWTPRSWFTGHTDLGLQTLARKSEDLLRRGDCPGCVSDNGDLYVDRGDRSVTTANIRGSFRLPSLRGVVLTPSVGANYVRTVQANLPIHAQDLAVGSSTINNAGIINVGEDSRAKLVQLGVFATTDINLFNRLNTSLGFRVDASNSLGKNVTPTYPKLDLSYVVPTEQWVSPSVVSILRIRTAYGHSAKQPEVGQSVRTYVARDGIREDGTAGSLLYLNTLGNPNLKPERSTDLEGGADATLFDDRVTVSITGYRKLTRDALVSLLEPVSLGGSTPRSGSSRSVVANLGKIKNTGGNATIDVRVLDRDQIALSVNASYDRNRNTLLKLAPTFDRNMKNIAIAYATFMGQRYIEGYPLDGIWLNPISTYADINGDGFLAYNEIIRSDSAVYVGGPLPNYTATFGSIIGLWKGRITIAGNARYENGMAQINQSIISMLTEEYARATTIPALNDPTVPLDVQAAYRSGYAAIHQASVFRLQSLSIRAFMPDEYARRLFRAQTMSVALQGNNLRLWTNYSGADPNVLSNITSKSAVDNGVLPQPRTWGLNVALTY